MSLGLIPAEGKGRKEDRAKGTIDVGYRPNDSLGESSLARVALQSCPELGCDGHACIPLHQSVIGCGPLWERT